MNMAETVEKIALSDDGIDEVRKNEGERAVRQTIATTQRLRSSTNSNWFS